MEADWKKTDEENERLFENNINEAKKASAAASDFFSAGQKARNSAKENGILPTRNEHGEFRYTVQQGLKAACHAREDVAAIAQIQLTILQRLDRNRNLLWIVIVFLFYIAFRIS